MKKKKTSRWKPLAEDTLDAIRGSFRNTFPEDEYGTLAGRIGIYWMDMLRRVWEDKPEEQKQADLSYEPDDPLSRISQSTVVITYPDSIQKGDEESLAVLNRFLKEYFPAIRGIHLLPSCTVAEDRFNDGYFSQIERTKIHPSFGTNRLFGEIAGEYYSMADFVLNHVDIRNPVFQAFLHGDDSAGNCFYIFSEEEYQRRREDGDFAVIFRPRPFPLFSIFRRYPGDSSTASIPLADRFTEMRKLILEEAGVDLSVSVIGVLYIFRKILNDQMLLDEDYGLILRFIDFLKETGVSPEEVFTLSQVQEVEHTPYIFRDGIDTRSTLLTAAGFGRADSEKAADVFARHDCRLFGEEVRVLTTFSHIQADLNTGTYEGLKMLADDFAWYLGLDLNMLRLDAANFAFKRWKTSCFGLPEVKALMKIMFLSMECVSPRIVANLEVNDSLTAVLTQMADKDAPPPMMYDFHLASMLPSVFLEKNPEILKRIPEKIAEFSIPPDSIRFSLAESHDGKSVRGSMDMLTISERQRLADLVESNRGKIKYKSVPAGLYPPDEFSAFCTETGFDEKRLKDALFLEEMSSGYYSLKPVFRSGDDVLKILGSGQADRGAGSGAAGPEEGTHPAVRFFINKIMSGKEPYELCISTRDSLEQLEDEHLEARRYLSFHTLAFALMGRNVKSIYFNDILALPNDYGRYRRTGELRDLKRTKSDYYKIKGEIESPGSFRSEITGGINRLIALADTDPALHFRGNEAGVLVPENNAPAAAVFNSRGDDATLTIVNLSRSEVTADVRLPRGAALSGTVLYDNLSSAAVPFRSDTGEISVTLKPFGSVWLKSDRISIEPGKLRGGQSGGGFSP